MKFWLLGFSRTQTSVVLKLGEYKVLIFGGFVEPKQALYWNSIKHICGLFLFLSRTQTSVVLKPITLLSLLTHPNCRTQTSVVLKLHNFASTTIYYSCRTQTSVVLKLNFCIVFYLLHLVEPKQALYWNYFLDYLFSFLFWSNPNKRCIETLYKHSF